MSEGSEQRNEGTGNGGDEVNKDPEYEVGKYLLQSDQGRVKSSLAGH